MVFQLDPSYTVLVFFVLIPFDIFQLCEKSVLKRGGIVGTIKRVFLSGFNGPFLVKSYFV